MVSDVSFLFVLPSPSRFSFFFFLMIRRPPRSTLFPSPTLFRSTQIKATGQRVQTDWGATLYHPDDLPFAVAQLPKVFTQFRKQVEHDSTVRAALPTPPQLPPVPTSLDPGAIPTLASLGLAAAAPDQRAVLAFVGGETAGLARLQDYVWEADCLKGYKQTRNGLLGANYSSKFSPWLALGCLSPRQIKTQHIWEFSHPAAVCHLKRKRRRRHNSGSPPRNFRASRVSALRYSTNHAGSLCWNKNPDEKGPQSCRLEPGICGSPCMQFASCRHQPLKKEIVAANRLPGIMFGSPAARPRLSDA